MSERIFPILETERCLLRELTDADAAAVLAFRSDPEVMKYIPRPLCKTEDDAKVMIRTMSMCYQKNDCLNWGIVLKETNQLVGIIGYFRTQHEHYRSELGYTLNRSYHGQGIMREVVHPVIHYGFENMHLHSIVAVTDPENEKSMALLYYTGFIKEGHFKENEFYDGQFIDSVHFGLLKQNYLEKHETEFKKQTDRSGIY